MRVTALLPVLFLTVCRGETVPPPDAAPQAWPEASDANSSGMWSEATNGVRGRLLFANGPMFMSGGHAGVIWVELQNLDGFRPKYFYYQFIDPPILGELRDSSGNLVQPLKGMPSDMIPPACWLALPPHSSLSFIPAPPAALGSTNACVEISLGRDGGAWFIPLTATNDYFLSAVLTMASPTNTNHPDAWQGVLNLPPVRVSVGPGLLKGQKRTVPEF